MLVLWLKGHSALVPRVPAPSAAYDAPAKYPVWAMAISSRSDYGARYRVALGSFDWSAY